MSKVLTTTGRNVNCAVDANDSARGEWMRAAGCSVALIAVIGLASAAHAQNPLPVLSQLEPLPAGAVESTGPPLEYFDIDDWMAANAGPTVPSDDWHWQCFPDGIIYQSYLAGAKESRLGTQYFQESRDGLLWDTTLGGKVGVLRYGTSDAAWAQGWQLDLEGSGQVRLDPEEDRDLRGADFRAGSALTYGYGRHRMRLGYYHISSHAGDEFLLKNPSFDRLNYVRDAINFGYAYYWTDNLRLYADTSWAFYGDLTGNWDFQFGFDYAPAQPTGMRGAPFVAMNGHLRQELNYSGNLVVQAGWAWRGANTSHLFRVGLHYYNGLSNQFEFFRTFEQQVGAGMWYDF